MSKHLLFTETGFLTNHGKDLLHQALNLEDIFNHCTTESELITMQIAVLKFINDQFFDLKHKNND